MLNLIDIEIYIILEHPRTYYPRTCIILEHYSRWGEPKMEN